jgi:two-component system nitrogen regulation response regulator GlnG
MKPIWIVDDDQSIRFVLEKALLRENLATRSFTNIRDVLAALENAGGSDGPQILVSDIRMPGGSGLELLEKVKRAHPALPVIIMTAFSDLDSAVSAFQGGAFEYLPKPFDLPKAVELIRRAMQESQREDVSEQRSAATPEMLGQAPAMRELFRAVGRLAQAPLSVLITGETGTGKELVARALHRHSPRAALPFVALNTAAIPAELLERTVRARGRRLHRRSQAPCRPLRAGRWRHPVPGRDRRHAGGVQTRLLRVLAEGEFFRVGGRDADPDQMCA